MKPDAAEAIPWKVLQLADARSLVNKEKRCQLNPDEAAEWTVGLKTPPDGIIQCIAFIINGLQCCGTAAAIMSSALDRTEPGLAYLANAVGAHVGAQNLGDDD